MVHSQLRSQELFKPTFRLTDKWQTWDIHINCHSLSFPKNSIYIIGVCLMGNVWSSMSDIVCWEMSNALLDGMLASLANNKIYDDAFVCCWRQWIWSRGCSLRSPLHRRNLVSVCYADGAKVICERQKVNTSDDRHIEHWMANRMVASNRSLDSIVEEDLDCEKENF